MEPCDHPEEESHSECYKCEALVCVDCRTAVKNEVGEVEAWMCEKCRAKWFADWGF